MTESVHYHCLTNNFFKSPLSFLKGLLCPSPQYHSSLIILSMKKTLYGKSIIFSYLLFLVETSYLTHNFIDTANLFSPKPQPTSYTQRKPPRHPSIRKGKWRQQQSTRGRYLVNACKTSKRLIYFSQGGICVLPAAKELSPKFLFFN